MSEFLNKIKIAFGDKSLRKRILFVISGLIIFRLLANIPIPSVDPLRLEQFFSNNQFFGFLDIFAGGGLSNLSIIMLGVGPYITASIIMQLSTMMFPRLKEMYQEEGEAGKRKFSQYTRLLSVPLAAMQAFAFLTLFARQGVIAEASGFTLILNVIIVVAGSMLLVWLGELMTEYGISSGISLIIFAGIVAGLPAVVSNLFFTYTPSMIPIYIGFVVAALLVIYGVVVMTEAERPIPITYAKRVRGMKVYGGVSTYLPIRLTLAGVIPIIFALSLLLLPQMIFQIVSTWLSNPTAINIAQNILNFISNGWVYAAVYFVLIFMFTYFYTAISFDPNQVSEGLQKSGAFIPGVRPGASTAEYISRILNRTTLVGALFLGFIAVLPLAVQAATGIASIALGGTGLLIVVSVVIDIVKKIDAQVSMREY